MLPFLAALVAGVAAYLLVSGPLDRGLIAALICAVAAAFGAFFLGINLEERIRDRSALKWSAKARQRQQEEDRALANQVYARFFSIDRLERQKAAEASKVHPVMTQAAVYYLSNILLSMDLSARLSEDYLRNHGIPTQPPNPQDAAEGLGNLQAPAAIAPLIQALWMRSPNVTAPRYPVQAAILTALGKYDSPEAMAALIKHLHQPAEDSDKSKLANVWALCTTKNPQAIPHILWAYKGIMHHTFLWGQEPMGAPWSSGIREALARDFVTPQAIPYLEQFIANETDFVALDLAKSVLALCRAQSPAAA